MSDDVKEATETEEAQPTGEAVDEKAESESENDPYDVTDPSVNDPSWGDPGDEDDSETKAEPDRGAESGGEDDGEDDDEAEAESEPEPESKPRRKIEPVAEDDDPDPEFEPEKYLDEELAREVARTRAEIKKLRAMLDGAGIVAPQEAAIAKVGKEFPDTFGDGVSLTEEQSEARSRLTEAADVLRQTYRKRGKASPEWDDLLKVAMSVEFPDLAQRADAKRIKAKRRESQRISRPTPRESDLSPTERAVRKARQMMLENAATESDPFSIR